MGARLSPALAMCSTSPASQGTWQCGKLPGARGEGTDLDMALCSHLPSAMTISGAGPGASLGPSVSREPGHRGPSWLPTASS